MLKIRFACIINRLVELIYDFFLKKEAMKDKESIEKTRINNRGLDFFLNQLWIYIQKYLVGYEARNLDMRDLLHNTDPQSTLFMPGL